MPFLDDIGVVLLEVQTAPLSSLGDHRMRNLHRFVWSDCDGRCTVVCADYGYDGILDQQAGAQLFALSQRHIALSDMHNASPKLARALLDYGWIDADGKINGTFTRVQHLPHLKRLQIELTTRCNLRCSYCYSESGPTKTSALSSDQVCATLSQAHDMGCIWVDFTGGEFFLYQQWQEVLSHARSLGLVTTVHTNGTPLSDGNVAYLAQKKIRALQVSLESHNASLHDATRGMSGALEKTVRGIRVAKKYGLLVKVCLMVHRRNVATVKDTVEWINKELGVQVMLDRVVAAGGEIGVGIGLSAAEYFEAIAPLVSRSVVSSRICDNASASASAVSPVEPHCGVAHNFVYLTADGEFALCPTMTSRDRAIFNGPRLPETDLFSAWLDSAYFNSYRSLNCKNVEICPASKKCGGGCRSNAYIETDELNSPDVFACNMNKNPTSSFVDFRQQYADGPRHRMIPVVRV